MAVGRWTNPPQVKARNAWLEEKQHGGEKDGGDLNHRIRTDVWAFYPAFRQDHYGEELPSNAFLLLLLLLCKARALPCLNHAFGAFMFVAEEGVLVAVDQIIPN